MSPLPLWRTLWPLRLIWLVVPVLIGPALADALSDRSRSVQLVGSVLVWGLWGMALAAMLVPRSSTLTAVRLIGPGALAVSLWAAIGAAETGWAAAGVAAGAVALVAMAGPGVADAFVDGSSYGTERRVALRSPIVLLAGPVPLAWLVAAACVVVGPLLLAAEQWVAGGLVTAVAVPVFVVVARQIHLLSRRWLVFVPAGVVVHDPFVLTEPVLLQRHLVTRIGPALADAAASDSGVFDTTGGALGLALEVAVAEPFSIGVRVGRGRTERRGVESLLVTPTQPATTMAIAADHRLPVG